ncbi:MAG: 2-oxoglutarate dehydrogenase E1 component [Rhizobiales bacterium]|nr:2-oxoglutarate dehydrogenase E1 component [Hyphomicrobiales bacterium]NRB14608.1 2-oxoglutarate dehydrogenase E1 component [Hyphomicrobiales bacterium]
MAKQAQNEAFDRTSFLYGGNASFIEDLYAKFIQNPDSVDPGWQGFFAEMADDEPDVANGAGGATGAMGASWDRPNWPPADIAEDTAALSGNWSAFEANIATKIAANAKNAAKQLAANTGVKAAPAAPKVTSVATPAVAAPAAALAPAAGAGASAAEIKAATLDSIRAIMMIRAFRAIGHLAADLDPLKMESQGREKMLTAEAFGFSSDDFDRPIFIDHVLGLEYATLTEILEILKRTYCSKIGIEFMHITDAEQKAWLQQRIEGKDKEIEFTANGKKAILNKLIETQGLENFIDKKYTGTKRFGLDGGEALIPALEQIIKVGGQTGVKDIVLGMPHRGRLNVLTAVMGKPYRALFHEFRGGASTPEEIDGSGDVKYHLGASSDRNFDGNKVHLSLTANPSHLEIVNPIVLGKVRAKQDQHSKFPFDTTQTNRHEVLPLLLHGDAAFAGQGVVAECFGLSGLKGHRTGGSIHFIVNNQIGFTTAPHYSRSSPYPSDVAKMIEAPIFHVNGDDPESVVYVARIATEYRQKFGKPVVIDMFCYRRFGHNEGDDPSMTQPIMYKTIKTHKTTLDLYSEKLVNDRLLSADDIVDMKDQFRKFLDIEFDESDDFTPGKADWLDGKWSDKSITKDDGQARRGQTGYDIDKLKQLGKKLVEIPDDFNAHKTLKRIYKRRGASIEAGVGIDWGTGEALAFATLLDEGFPVRLSGQDCERGTFVHRHSVLNDQMDETTYKPLNNLREGQGRYEVINSMLSEEAVLGFEYGYSLTEPDCLTIWEAQFGDFANGAQVLFDQFISSGEQKWLRMSGLVCLLPHGYEGQGPEHSSARPERFLQLCAEDNMIVANVTTPANFFHILRRQLKRDYRKPLIIMTPKSLLRHKRCVSTIEEIGPNSEFHRVLWDDAEYLAHSEIRLQNDDKIRKVIICSGKVYYDLYEDRIERDIDDVYILRVEQLYPFPKSAMAKELSRFENAEIIWCQEEPKNMGYWTFVNERLEDALIKAGNSVNRATYVGRKAAASPATGSGAKHRFELKTFLDEAFK